MRRIAVIGAGSWGTALCRMVADRGHDVTLWAYEQEVLDEVRKTRINSIYLPGFPIPETVEITGSLEEAVSDAGIIVTVFPSHVARSVYRQMRPYLSPRTVVVSATKGIENESLMSIHEVVRDVLRDDFEPRYVALSGPSFALEVAQDHPTAVVAASTTPEYAELIQQELSSASFRIYTSRDVTSVEIGGAVKNVMAIAAGVVAGLGWGYNSSVALATRGLAEMTRLAVALGGRAETMAGLAGMGDLMLTCMGSLSRNRQVGVELGRGRHLDQILADMRMVAEGVKTTRATYELSRRLGVEMPITTCMYRLLYRGESPQQAAEELMMRPLRREIG